MNENENESKKNRAFRFGMLVLVLLAMLTGSEYLVGSFASGLWVGVMLFALAKAFLVIREYMHLPRLFSTDEEDHS